MEQRKDEMGVLLITHYYRVLEHLSPDVVHVLYRGQIVESGGADLARRIEKDGYEPILGALAAGAPS